MNITTTMHDGKVTAAGTFGGKRRQATIGQVEVQTYRSGDAQHGAAVGALLAKVCDDRQKAMLRHPSGAQRVTNDSGPKTTNKVAWKVNV